MRWLTILAALMAVGLAASFLPGVRPKPQPPLTPQQKAEKDSKERVFQADLTRVKTLKAAMKNPDSFKLEQALRMPDGTLCLSYRATNSFNAIVPGEAVLGKGSAITSDDSERFPGRWNALCGGKSGVDITYLRQGLF